jgi:hypothetical protein
MQALSLTVANRKRYCVTLVFSLRHDHIPNERYRLKA